MWNPFKKKSIYLGVKASKEPFPGTPGFSYILKVPKYFKIPSGKTGVHLRPSTAYLEAIDKPLVIVTLITLEAIIIEQDIVRCVFSQKYASNQSVTVAKFHYLLCKEDYRRGRLESGFMVLGDTLQLTVFLNDGTPGNFIPGEITGDFEKLFNDGRFNSLFDDMRKMFDKYRK